LGLVDGKDESASGFVFRVLPFGLNTLFEELDGVDFAPLVVDFEAE